MTVICVIAETIALLALLLASAAFVLRLRHAEPHYAIWGQIGIVVGGGLLAVGLASHLLRGTGPLGGFANYSFGLALLLGAVVLVAERRGQRQLLAAVLTPLMLGAALMGLVRANSEVPSLHGNVWLGSHIALTMAAYACFALAFAMAVAYLLGNSLLKRKQLDRLRPLPPLDTADRIGYRAALVGWLLFTVGLLVGAATVFRWGAGADAKIPAAIVTWGVYSAYLVLRHFANWRGWRLQWLLVAGFAMVVLTFAVFGHDPGQLRQSGPASPAAAQAR